MIKISSIMKRVHTLTLHVSKVYVYIHIYKYNRHARARTYTHLHVHTDPRYLFNFHRVSGRAQSFTCDSRPLSHRYSSSHRIPRGNQFGALS